MLVKCQDPLPGLVSLIQAHLYRLLTKHLTFKIKNLLHFPAGVSGNFYRLVDKLKQIIGDDNFSTLLKLALEKRHVLKRTEVDLAASILCKIELERLPSLQSIFVVVVNEGCEWIVRHASVRALVLNYAQVLVVL